MLQFLTVRQLVRHRPSFDVAEMGRTAFVCENPTVIAVVADRLGPGSAPMICTEGQPTTAAGLLLDQLATAGICLKYHCDFDWGGIRIANTVIQRHGARPWRLATEDYVHATSAGGAPLGGEAVAACWDSHLEPTMVEAGCAIHEESVLDSLLTDLAI